MRKKNILLLLTLFFFKDFKTNRKLNFKNFNDLKFVFSFILVLDENCLKIWLLDKKKILYPEIEKYLKFFFFKFIINILVLILFKLNWLRNNVFLILNRLVFIRKEKK